MMIFEKFTSEHGQTPSEGRISIEKKLHEDYTTGAISGKLWEEFPRTSADLALQEDFHPFSDSQRIQWKVFSLESDGKGYILELRPLNEKEKAKLKSIHMTDENINKCQIDSSGIIYLSCKNQEYADRRHPETGILYVEKVINIDGVRIKGVFPEFTSIFDITLPKSLRYASESTQFKYLNNQLCYSVKSNPKLQRLFSEKQLAMIQDGKKPAGYTWHHNEEAGIMQLVRSDEHGKTGHTGGNSIWSGGV